MVSVTVRSVESVGNEEAEFMEATERNEEMEE
jgi:hypothetical protein